MNQKKMVPKCPLLNPQKKSYDIVYKVLRSILCEILNLISAALGLENQKGSTLVRKKVIYAISTSILKQPLIVLLGAVCTPSCLNLVSSSNLGDYII